MEKQFRQGDVYLVQVDKLPEGARKKPYNERIVLAWGEATGHTHSISNTEAYYYVDNQQDYLVVPDLANLVHEEHSTIAIPAGVYQVVRQIEYDPSSWQRYVLD